MSGNKLVSRKQQLVNEFNEMNQLQKAYFKHVLLCALCFALYSYQAQTKSKEVTTQNGKKYYIHKVEKGQSLYGIAKIYNIDVNSILAENDHAVDGLKNGQELKIPFESLLPKTPQALDTNKYVYHKIQKGETFYALTKKYAIDEKQLKMFNPSMANGLREGEYMIVSEKKKISTPKITTSHDTTYYIPNQGETLYGIANKFNVQQQDVLMWNPVAKNGLKQGQTLKLVLGKPHVTNTPATPAGQDSVFLNKPKKSIYHIGLFLPFKLQDSTVMHLEELIKSKTPFPATQSLALDFYTGFKIAMDSLISKDFEVNLHLYDIDERDSSSTEAICRTSEFKSLDAIFGPLYSSVFRIASMHAKKLHIPSVSPLTQQNKILFDNPLASKVNLSQYTLIESLANYCTDSLMATSNIIIVNTTTKDKAYIKSFKNKYNENLMLQGKSLKDTLREAKGIAGVKAAYVPGKKNVVVLLTTNQVYLQDFITQLYIFSDKKDIVLMGFNSVSSIDNLDQSYLNDLHFHYATAHIIDYTNPLTKQLIKHYQEMYFTDPSDYYFEAYDIASYYLSHLKAEGPSFFLNLDRYPWSGVATGFKFYRPDVETGFENRAVSIYKYADYKLQKSGWK